MPYAALMLLRCRRCAALDVDDAAADRLLLLIRLAAAAAYADAISYFSCQIYAGFCRFLSCFSRCFSPPIRFACHAVSLMLFIYAIISRNIVTTHRLPRRHTPPLLF